MDFTNKIKNRRIGKIMIKILNTIDKDENLELENLIHRKKTNTLKYFFKVKNNKYKFDNLIIFCNDNTINIFFESEDESFELDKSNYSIINIDMYNDESYDIVFKNSFDQIHRNDGPAIITYNMEDGISKYYCQYGKALNDLQIEIMRSEFNEN